MSLILVAEMLTMDQYSTSTICKGSFNQFISHSFTYIMLHLLIKGLSKDYIWHCTDEWTDYILYCGVWQIEVEKEVHSILHADGSNGSESSRGVLLMFAPLTIPPLIFHSSSSSVYFPSVKHNLLKEHLLFVPVFYWTVETAYPRTFLGPMLWL